LGERRAYPRLHGVFAATCIGLSSEWAEFKSEVRVLDISLGGCQLDVSFPRQSKLRLLLHIPGERAIGIDAEVMYADEPRGCRVRFICGGQRAKETIAKAVVASLEPLPER